MLIKKINPTFSLNKEKRIISEDKLVETQNKSLSIRETLQAYENDFREYLPDHIALQHLDEIKNNKGLPEKGWFSLWYLAYKIEGLKVLNTRKNIGANMKDIEFFFRDKNESRSKRSRTFGFYNFPDIDGKTKWKMIDKDRFDLDDQLIKTEETINSSADIGTTLRAKLLGEYSNDAEDNFEEYTSAIESNEKSQNYAAILNEADSIWKNLKIFHNNNSNTFVGYDEYINSLRADEKKKISYSTQIGLTEVKTEVQYEKTINEKLKSIKKDFEKAEIYDSDIAALYGLALTINPNKAKKMTENGIIKQEDIQKFFTKEKNRHIFYENGNWKITGTIYSYFIGESSRRQISTNRPTGTIRRLQESTRTQAFYHGALPDFEDSKVIARIRQINPETATILENRYETFTKIQEHREQFKDLIAEIKPSKRIIAQIKPSIRWQALPEKNKKDLSKIKIFKKTTQPWLFIKTNNTEYYAWDQNQNYIKWDSNTENWIEIKEFKITDLNISKTLQEEETYKTIQKINELHIESDKKTALNLAKKISIDGNFTFSKNEKNYETEAKKALEKIYLSYIIFKPEQAKILAKIQAEKLKKDYFEENTDQDLSQQITVNLEENLKISENQSQKAAKKQGENINELQEQLKQAQESIIPQFKSKIAESIYVFKETLLKEKQGFFSGLKQAALCLAGLISVNKSGAVNSVSFFDWIKSFGAPILKPLTENIEKQFPSVGKLIKFPDEIDSLKIKEYEDGIILKQSCRIPDNCKLTIYKPKEIQLPDGITSLIYKNEKDEIKKIKKEDLISLNKPIILYQQSQLIARTKISHCKLEKT